MRLCHAPAEKTGKLNREGIAKALQTTKNFDSRCLSAPWTIRNNRFPVATEAEKLSDIGNGMPQEREAKS